LTVSIKLQWQVLDNTFNKLTIIVTAHVPCSLYHSTCTDLEPFKDEGDTFLLNVRNSLSSDASSHSEHQDLLLCTGSTELVQTCCGAPLLTLCYVMLCYVMLCYVMLCYVMLCYVMLYYVCKHVYIHVTWNSSCCQRQFTLFFSFVAKINLY
jgi:hypothetical protein